MKEENQEPQEEKKKTDYKGLIKETGKEIKRIFKEMMR